MRVFRTFNPLVGSSNLPHPTNRTPHQIRKACYLKHSGLFLFYSLNSNFVAIGVAIREWLTNVRTEKLAGDYLLT